MHNTTQRSNDATSTAIARHGTTNTQIPKGVTVYTTTMPAPCSENWVENQGSYDCYKIPPHITGKPNSNALGGILLNQLPGQSYPNDYVVQLHIESIGQSAFGIYFRNQPGTKMQGTYTFLVNPNGTWQVNVYNNTTGDSKQLKSGTHTAIGVNTWVTLDVIANGPNFSFYINDKQVCTMHDTTYLTGTVGIAVDHDGEVAANQFNLYTTAP